jgi:hypothetical protein
MLVEIADFDVFSDKAPPDAVAGKVAIACASTAPFREPFRHQKIRLFAWGWVAALIY